MDILRTPDERFLNLAGYFFAPHYVELDGLRAHYVDEGPPNAPVVLMLHGEPTWSYLYRAMVPELTRANLRAIVPDLIGFGRSDKLVRREEYSYEFHVATIHRFIDALDLRDVTLFAQDWGGLIGLRVVGERPDRFARVVAANTFLPTGDRPPTDAFLRWRDYSQSTPAFRPGRIVRGGCQRLVSESVMAAYDAPFPDERYLAGARAFPMLVPVGPDDPGSEPNRAAWEVLRLWEKPFLTLFADSDPITAGADRYFQRHVPGALGQPHKTIAAAGHFIQEDAGSELGALVAAFVQGNATPHRT
ncbi:MAG: haloalkane dehalogenase [Gemmatimonadota bacterium]